MKKIVSFIMIATCVMFLKAQSTGDVLNVLVKNNVLSQQEVDTLKQKSLPDKKARIDLDIRPRSEFRNGFKQLRYSGSNPAFVTLQRSRANFNFVQEGKFSAQLSFQDVRAWGQYDNKTIVGTVNIFEGWIEPVVCKNTSIRIGRQALAFDNQRLFSASDWNPQSTAHDALNIRYNDSKLNSDLAVAFNQNNADTLFGTNYVNANLYKFMSVSYIKYKLNDAITLSLTNVADGFQADTSLHSTDFEKLYIRITNGGRVEYKTGSLNMTLSGYYQWGKTNKNLDISAWYLQPEASFTTESKLKLALGAEIISGKSNTDSSKIEKNFNGLYGGAHGFNGIIDIMDNFAKDQHKAGLINPYISIYKTIFKTVEIRTDFHLFYLQQDYIKTAGDLNSKIDKNLGWENDWRVTWSISPIAKLEGGFAFLSGTESMTLVKNKGNKTKGDATLPQTWAYISLSFKPQILNSSFK